MAVETVELLSKNGDAIRMYVDDSTQIDKGTILYISNGRTANKFDSDGDRAVGIASADKEENDGAESIAVYRQGIFEGTADGSISAGDMLKGAGDDKVASTSTATEMFARALTDADDGDKVEFIMGI